MISAAFLAGGCDSFVKNVDDPTAEVGDSYEAVCPLVEQEVLLMVDAEEIRNCLAWDETTETYGVDLSSIDPALSFLGGCTDPTAAVCLIETGTTVTYQVERNTSCPQCFFESDGALGDPDVCCDYAAVEEEIDQARLDAMMAINGYCSPGIGLMSGGGGVDAYATWEVCDTAPSGSLTVTNSTDYIFYIDAVDSSITLTQGANTETVEVEGYAFVATSPARAITASMWAEPASLGTTTYTDWRFGLDGIMGLDVASGSFTIDSDGAPLMRGRGMKGSVDSVATIGMGQDAAGQLNLSTMRWYVDYNESLGNKSIGVHLEGDVVAQ